MATRTRDFRVEHFEDVTIVRFTTDLIDSSNYQPIADELKELAEQEGVRKLLVNLSKVEFLFSFALGHFAALSKRLRQDGGDLRFCGLRPSVQQIFLVTQFNRMVQVYESEPAALKDWALGQEKAAAEPEAGGEDTFVEDTFDIGEDSEA